MLLGVVGAVLARNVQIGLTVQNVFDFRASKPRAGLLRGLFALMPAGSPDGPRPQGTVPLRPDPLDGLAGGHVDPALALRALDGVDIAVLIAAAVQLVSPWNEAAAAYAQYVRASEKQKRKAKVVRRSCRRRVEEARARLPREQVPEF